MCQQSPARPAARPPGPAAASTSSKSWPASPRRAVPRPPRAERTGVLRAPLRGPVMNLDRAVLAVAGTVVLLAWC